uniref:Uncharacterized protein n=1 Tax=Opuntia streptacantha TaxID=393608 RepID=A0A7C8ZLZ4_OPUST
MVSQPPIEGSFINLLFLNLSSTLGNPLSTFFTKKSQPLQFLKKPCLSNFSAVGLLDGSWWRHRPTKSLNPFENLFRPPFWALASQSAKRNLLVILNKSDLEGGK